jgi:hypothetical protein
VTAVGGPPRGCVDEGQVLESLVDAVGCLRRTSLLELPPRERQLVFGELLGYFAGLNVPGLDDLSSSPKAGRARAAALPRAAELGIVHFLQSAYAPARIFVSTRPVRINGLDYTPGPGAAVVLVSPGLIEGSRVRAHVISSDVTISAPTHELGRVDLRHAKPLVLPVDTQRERIAELRLRQGVPFAEGSQLQGVATALLRDRASDLRMELALPPVFGKPGGGRVSAAVTLRATNSDGIRLDGFEVRNVDAEIAGVGVAVEFLRYSFAERVLAGKARVSFLPLGAIDGELAVRGSRVEKLDATYTAGPPGIKVAPAVFLTRVRAGFEDSPARTALFGGASLAAGVGLGNGCAPVGVNGVDPPGFDFRIDPRPVTITVQGQMEIACIPVAFQRFVLAEDGYAHYSAGLSDYDLGVARLSANWGVTFYDGRFTAEGKASASIGDFGSAGGSALLSDRGLAFCGDFGFFDAGFGLDWSPPPVNIGVLLANLDIMVPSCDLGPWRTVTARARASQAGPATVRIPAGQRMAMIGVVGVDGAPRVVVRGPAGRTIAMPASGPVRTAHAVAFRVPARRTTFVAIDDPAPGAWTVEPQDGARIAQVRRAAALPEPQVRATVGGGRGARVVRYRVVPRRGQVVRLLERAPGGTRELGTVRRDGFVVASSARGAVRVLRRGARAGALRLVPSDARGKRRALLAMVEQDGVPREQITLDRFRAGPPAIGRVGSIRAHRSRRGRLAVTWSRAAGAQRYLVGMELSDGRERLLRPRGRRVVINAVRPGTRVTVRILGARVGGARRGPATTRRFVAR